MRSNTLLAVSFLAATGILHSCKEGERETIVGPTVYLTDTLKIDISTGLVLYHPLAGNLIDSSGSGLNGIGQSITFVSDRFGTSNSAANFNGSTSFIRIGDVLDTVFCKPIARFSVSGWAYTNQMGSLAGGGGMFIGKNGGGNDGPYEFSLSHVDSKVYADVFFDTLASNYVRLTYPVPSQTWFHFALVFDGNLDTANRAKLYINGLNLVGSTRSVIGSIGTGCANSTQHLTIGSGHPLGNPTIPGNQYNGVLSDIRIYNRPLTAEQIGTLYIIR